VKELLCIFKKVHVSIHTQVLCLFHKENLYQVINNVNVVNKLRTLVCLELVMHSCIMKNLDHYGVLGYFSSITS
jgi:hypothetical protein